MTAWKKSTSTHPPLREILPVNIRRPLQRWNFLLVLFSCLLVCTWAFALFGIQADTDQGNVYRIMFVHVPVAWCAFFWVFTGAFFGLLVLMKPQSATIYDRSSHTALESGCLFSALVLISGSIWGRATWGVWWDWDPRLTSSLVMFFVCCGYLILRYFTPDARARRTLSAVVSILSAVNVPIVYYSVNMWRSLHQPQTFIRKTTTASSDIGWVLFANSVALLLLSFVIYKIRRQSISAEETLQTAREMSQ